VVPPALGQPKPSGSNDPTVWTDETTADSGVTEPVVGNKPLVSVGDPRHFDRMQTKVLWGIGIFFLASLLAVIIGPAVHAISEDLAKEIMKTVLPPVMASAATIVGTLFVSGATRQR
jgi:hypothetical protein